MSGPPTPEFVAVADRVLEGMRDDVCETTNAGAVCDPLCDECYKIDLQRLAYGLPPSAGYRRSQDGHLRYMDTTKVRAFALQLARDIHGADVSDHELRRAEQDLRPLIEARTKRRLRTAGVIELALRSLKAHV